jgi:hypothetical protein
MDDRTCDYCGKPLSLDARGNQRYCGRTHKRQARRQAKRREEMHASLVTAAPLYADMSLSELDDRRREHRAAEDPGDGVAEYADWGQLPEDTSVSGYGDGGQDEQDVRVHKMLRTDAARRVPRRPWAALRRSYAANPGVEAADITQERTERHQAQQNSVRVRLRTAPGQVQDRHNPVTDDAVATRANGSRRLNKARATADPRPVAQRQSFSFEAEQATWDTYRGGRARGQQSRHSGYAWNMDDGFRH